MTIRAIVTDIEGTTSSLSFVKDVLFPYSRRHLADYVRRHQADDTVKAILADVASQIGHPLDVEQCIATLNQWIAEDRKFTPLKSLQGLIWEAGYRNGDFTGHIYADAAQQLRRWREAGIVLSVYSSGSVHAQKLLFAHTEFGDLTPLFSHYFDTTIGHKRESGSYSKILQELQIPAAQTLFLSDIAEELDAARAAGMETMLLAREDSAGNADTGHPTARDFTEVQQHILLKNDLRR